MNNKAGNLAQLKQRIRERKTILKLIAGAKESIPQASFSLSQFFSAFLFPFPLGSAPAQKRSLGRPAGSGK